MLALFEPLRRATIETVKFAFVDPEWRLLGLLSITGGVASISFRPRPIVVDALAYDAAGVIMAHNHPSGDPTPSPADRAATARLAHALHGIDVRLIDHLIVAGDRWTSFRTAGLL